MKCDSIAAFNLLQETGHVTENHTYQQYIDRFSLRHFLLFEIAKAKT